MKRYLIVILLTLFISCIDNDLSPVSGIEGNINFHEEWPDSLKGVILVALDEEAVIDTENPEKYIISYGGAILPGTISIPYFIQLKPGAYYLVLLGIKEDPAFFVTNLDSFLTAPVVPIYQITDPFLGIGIQDNQTIRYKDWDVYF